MQWINNFLVGRKNKTKTQIKRSKIKLQYLLAPSVLNRAKCSACADKFPTCFTRLYRLAWLNRWTAFSNTRWACCFTQAVYRPFSSYISFVWSRFHYRYKGRHSFRIGAATFAAENGYSDAQIRLMGRWQSDVYRKYIRCPSLSSNI